MTNPARQAVASNDDSKNPAATLSRDGLAASTDHHASIRKFVRGSWNRVLTGYNKDSDVFLAGVGYRF